MRENLVGTFFVIGLKIRFILYFEKIIISSGVDITRGYRGYKLWRDLHY